MSLVSVARGRASSIRPLAKIPESRRQTCGKRSDLLSVSAQ